jgi:ribonuclease D
MTTLSIDKPVVVRNDLPVELSAALHAAPRIAWDTETSGLDWRVERIGTC